MTTGEGRPAPASDAATDRPLTLDCGATGLTIQWTDSTQQIDPRDLRLACRCAACRDEVSGKPLLDPATIALDVAPTRIWSVGNYALGVAFSDGHNSGIYTWLALREIESTEAEDV